MNNGILESLLDNEYIEDSRASLLVGRLSSSQVFQEEYQDGRILGHPRHPEWETSWGVVGVLLLLLLRRGGGGSVRCSRRSPFLFL